ncbi:MAG: cupin domain-containing protein [Ruminococcaceae bacterium]|nr:cupin domain-containing protein [Oscillospiraceae bacterium]
MRFGKINLGKFFDKESDGNGVLYNAPSLNGNHEKHSGEGACRDKACHDSSKNGECGCRSDASSFGERLRGERERLYGGENNSAEKKPSCRCQAEETESVYCSEKRAWDNGALKDTAPGCSSGAMRDRGNEPIVFDIRKEAFMTPDFRTALWTGGNLQLTVMTIPVGEETGIERHEGIDQLVGVISGAGEVLFGNRENYFADPIPLDAHSVILIPAGTYHNVKNVGRTPLKLYSVYAPKSHKFGAVDKIKPQ